MPQLFHAVLSLRPVVSECDEGPFHVCVLNPEGGVANTGQRFASRQEARAFADGLDMAARLFDARVIFSDDSRATAGVL